MGNIPWPGIGHNLVEASALFSFHDERVRTSQYFQIMILNEITYKGEKPLKLLWTQMDDLESILGQCQLMMSKSGVV
jgi:hypothetical protein